MQPIGMPWYMQDNPKNYLGRLSLDPEIYEYIESILQKGYCIVRNSVSSDLINECTNDFAAFKTDAIQLAEPSEAGKYRRIVNLHCLRPKFAELFSKNHKVLRILDILFEEPAVLYTSLFFEIGSAQPLHRDTPYFWTNPNYKYFGVWVALEQADEENGALQLLPGSHLIAEENREDIGHEFYANLNEINPSDSRLWESYQNKVLNKSEGLGLTPFTACVDAGDTVIWHPQTMHGGKNISNKNRTRLSQAMHVTPANVPVYHQQYFFNPTRNVDCKINWLYRETYGRKYIYHQSFSFEHQFDYNIEEYTSRIKMIQRLDTKPV